MTYRYQRWNHFPIWLSHTVTGSHHFDPLVIKRGNGKSLYFFQWWWMCYPLVNVQKTMERSTIFSGKTHYKWQCSIAMLNYQRVNHRSKWWILQIHFSWGQTISTDQRVWQWEIPGLVMTNSSPWFFDGPNRKFDGKHRSFFSMVDLSMANCECHNQWVTNRNWDISTKMGG